MRTATALTAMLVLGVCVSLARPAVAQTTISDADCQAMRQRLSEHARLSEGVRRAVTALANAAPPAPGAPAPAASAPAPTRRAETIRARLEQIPAERQALEEQRLGAMTRFELSRAGQLQLQIQALDAEKANLEREQATLPAAPAAPVPTTSAAAAPPADPIQRISCQEMPAALDNALDTRRRELGAREKQAGAVPLVALKGQTAAEIAQELAGQFASGPAATAQVGLFDADGAGRLDGFVDVPAPGIFRMVRQRADGTISLEVFQTAAAGSMPAYGEMTRRLDEATVRQTGQTLAELLAMRPAGAARATTQTAEFAAAHAQFQAGNFAEAARLGAPAGRSAEFQNFQGRNVRVLEIISPVTGGVSVRRVVAVVQPNDQELVDETTTVVRPASYWRTDIEVTRRSETRAADGTVTGTPLAPAPHTFSLER